jgi:hypothetical protein
MAVKAGGELGLQLGLELELGLEKKYVQFLLDE